MKKFLIILSFFLSLPSHALCPVETNGESVCSITNFDNKSPIFQMPNSENNMNSSQGVVQPMRQENALNNQIYEQSDSIMKYNSGCQFGICVQDLNNTKNKNQ